MAANPSRAPIAHSGLTWKFPEPPHQPRSPTNRLEIRSGRRRAGRIPTSPPPVKAREGRHPWMNRTELRRYGIPNLFFQPCRHCGLGDPALYGGNGTPGPHSLRTLSHGLPARWRSSHRPLQLALRAETRRRIHPARRRHRPGPQYRGSTRRDPRGNALAGTRVGRRSGGRRRLRPLLPVSTLRDL